MIRLNNLEKYYETGPMKFFVLRRITLEVKQGEFVTIMGPSGAGKSIPLSYRNVRSSERKAIVCDTLDRFNIVAKKDLYPSQLSGGQQQLVAVARAVVASPKLILADEPTGNLHSSQAQEIMELFKKLNGEGATIIQVTHSEKNASYGDRTIYLEDGWMAKEPPPDVRYHVSGR